MAEAKTEAGDWSPADYVVLRLTIEEAHELEPVLAEDVRASAPCAELEAIHTALRGALEGAG